MPRNIHWDNILDDPEKFERCHCPLCRQCWLHKTERRCIYGGPFVGYETRSPIPGE